MADVAIYTDVASRLEKGTEPAWARDHVVGARRWLTFVTVGELCKWAQVRGGGEVSRAATPLGGGTPGCFSSTRWGRPQAHARRGPARGR